MKKTIGMLLVMALLLCLGGCGMSAEAKQVTKLIEAIGDVTLESEAAITAAEEAYAALTDEQKAEVEIADYLPIYRNNYDILRQEADYQALCAALCGEWADLTRPGETAITLRSDGSAVIEDYDYTWTLNRNLQTVRFEGVSQIVMALGLYDDRPVLQNPDLMTCVKRDDWGDYWQERFVTVSVSPENAAEYIGEATDVGALPDAAGNETKDRLFAFRSSAYDRGLVFFAAADDFLLEYNAGRQLRGLIYKPYEAVPYGGGNVLGAMKLVRVEGTLCYIRAEYVASVDYDAETATRSITLTNGLVLDSSTDMNPSLHGSAVNAYAYLADPAFGF